MSIARLESALRSYPLDAQRIPGLDRMKVGDQFANLIFDLALAFLARRHRTVALAGIIGPSSARDGINSQPTS